MGTLAKAVASGGRRETLVALRDKLATTIDGTDSGRDIAALSKRLMEVEAELDALPDPKAKQNPLQKEAARAKSKRKG